MFSNNNNSLEESSVPTSTTPGTESVTVIEQPANSAAASAAALSSSGSSGVALPLGHSPAQNSTSQSGKLNQEDVSHEMQKELLSLMGLDQLPEMETFEVELVKDQQGLGITIAGYVCEKGKDGKSLTLPPFGSRSGGYAFLLCLLSTPSSLMMDLLNFVTCSKTRLWASCMGAACQSRRCQHARALLTRHAQCSRYLPA